MITSLARFRIIIAVHIRLAWRESIYSTYKMKETIPSMPCLYSGCVNTFCPPNIPGFCTLVIKLILRSKKKRVTEMNFLDGQRTENVPIAVPSLVKETLASKHCVNILFHPQQVLKLNFICQYYTVGLSVFRLKKDFRLFVGSVSFRLQYRIISREMLFCF